MSLPPGTSLGPYEIEAPLGAGGMGEVYKARDTRLERTVAIKVLPEHLASDPDRRRQFEREAKTISSLNHPHICTLYDIGEHEGTGFLVMEHLEGETLSDRLAREGALTTEDAVRYGSQIASALEKAHQWKIIHRDLKPSNVMLTESGAKVLDFGIATREADPALETVTRSATSLTGDGIAGTVPYMAPEALRGDPADARPAAGIARDRAERARNDRPALSQEGPDAAVSAGGRSESRARSNNNRCGGPSGLDPAPAVSAHRARARRLSGRRRCGASRLEFARHPRRSAACGNRGRDDCARCLAIRQPVG
jgi:serine/threonine protein kinase